MKLLVEYSYGYQVTENDYLLGSDKKTYPISMTVDDILKDFMSFSSARENSMHSIKISLVEEFDDKNTKLDSSKCCCMKLSSSDLAAKYEEWNKVSSNEEKLKFLKQVGILNEGGSLNNNYIGS